MLYRDIRIRLRSFELDKGETDTCMHYAHMHEHTHGYTHVQERIEATHLLHKYVCALNA